MDILKIAYPELISNQKRLDTFQQWPKDEERVSPEELSCSGFFYTNDRDIVTCFCCGYQFIDWLPEDNVDEEHIKASPQCNFIKTRIIKTSPKCLSNDLHNHESKGTEYDKIKDLLNKFCKNTNVPEYQSTKDALHPKYESYQTRLESFHKRPIGMRSLENLSSSGFFYNISNCKVMCFYCGYEFEDLLQIDVDEYHSNNSPQCNFIKTRIVLEREVDRHIAQYPEYESNRARLESFQSWPEAMPQKAIEMADTGLFYMKYGDKTRCYYCGVEINNWQADQKPSEEHAKRSPKCYHLRKRVNSKIELSQQNKNCYVCKIKVKTHIIIPCGHMITCNTCEYQKPICPICQKVCMKIIKVYRI